MFANPVDEIGHQHAHSDAALIGRQLVRPNRIQDVALVHAEKLGRLQEAQRDGLCFNFDHAAIIALFGFGGN